MSDKPVLLTPAQADTIKADTDIASAALADMQATKPELYGDGDSHGKMMAELYAPTPSKRHSRKVLAVSGEFTLRHGAIATGIIAAGTAVVKSIDWIFEILKHAFHFHGG